MSGPRIDKDLLREHHEGLIALSACLAGGDPRLLRNGQYEAAKQEALAMRELFGADGYYLSSRITLFRKIPRSCRVCCAFMRIPASLWWPPTTPTISLRPTPSPRMLCIQMGKTVDDPGRMKFETEEFYVKSEAEMRALFPQCP